MVLPSSYIHERRITAGLTLVLACDKYVYELLNRLLTCSSCADGAPGGAEC